MGSCLSSASVDAEASFRLEDEEEAELERGGTCVAAKILANLLIMGSGIMARALVQAYRQALTNASKSGVAQETLQNTIRRTSKTMAEPEARQILGVTEQSSWEDILQKYDTLFERNAKNGSFYLQSKVHKAKECLEAVYQGKAQGTTGS
ncbi:hypothetical protein HHK36_025269 [Tetracentron sinense]|uniref:Uncharacterized protein n=1 Tax=Tetracentron sinense TaxID=13715 RepID=A0A834YRL5_TETSI|nr:hypothetical protein HHK36_025269 [Tetracentron sinense]